MNLPTGPTVLIVDDDPQVRTVYSAYLEEDYVIRTAKSGDAALEEMDQEIDVVLLDRRMGGLSGGDVLRQLRERGFEQPVALVTAVEPDFDIIEMGFDEYVVKPVEQDELKDVVGTMLLRKEYDAVMREYFSLVSKVTALQMEKHPEQLREDDGYVQSQIRLDEIKEQARTALDVAIEEGKFDELARDLNAPLSEGNAAGTPEAEEIVLSGDD